MYGKYHPEGNASQQKQKHLAKPMARSTVKQLFFNNYKKKFFSSIIVQIIIVIFHLVKFLDYFLRLLKN